MTAKESNQNQKTDPKVKTLNDLAQLVDNSFLDQLNIDPDADLDGNNVTPRQVFSGHYVPVKPMPIENPEYIAHSKQFFKELGLSDDLAQTEEFIKVFSGDLSEVPEPMKKYGWATGYALSIYGSEYIQQCPFKTGNGYGDGRAASILEVVTNSKRWEMQLKGSGQTPYSRGADGRAVLRSSVREFLAQEHMHALGVPTSRSLSLYVSKTEKVKRPWYTEGSRSTEPDIMVDNAVAISTRVAPSFLRVGQIELFGRRARWNSHPKAMEELEKIVLHLIDREYSGVIDQTLELTQKVTKLAIAFRQRLILLVTHWIRVGYCQGNFNSDNCAAGGYTLDYGPFGFCELFDPYFQPWTGGGEHYSFLNQPLAAQRNFMSFCTALKPLLTSDEAALQQLEDIQNEFPVEIQNQLNAMWAAKLGLEKYEHELFKELITLMMQTSVDYTVFFRELSSIPKSVDSLKKSFYTDSKQNDAQWAAWLKKWNGILNNQTDFTVKETKQRMKRVNPKYTLREWFQAPAYQAAAHGDYGLIRELQNVMCKPYEEQDEQVDDQFNQIKPTQFFGTGGLSHYSCSS